MAYFYVRPFVKCLKSNSVEVPAILAIAGDRHFLFFPQTSDEAEQIDHALAGNEVAEVSDFLVGMVERDWAELSPNPPSCRDAVWSSEWTRQLSAYSTCRTINQAAAVHRMIAQSHVAIVGMGGIGTNVAQQLARIGVSRFTLIDADIVEKSNLNRQVLYFQDDIGKPKVQVAAKELSRITGKESQIDCLMAKVDEALPSVQQGVSLMIVSADDSPVAIQHSISQYCYPKRIPYIFAHYGGSLAEVGPVIMSFDNGCGCCLADLVKPQLWFSEIPRGDFPFVPPSSMAVNGMLAALLIEIWTRALSGACASTGTWRVELSEMSLRYETIKRLDTCSVCGEG